MQSALREGTINENDILRFVEVSYCLEGGLYPMIMEIPLLNKYFEETIEVKDARLETNLRWSVCFVMVHTTLGQVAL